MWYINTMEYYSALKKEILLFATMCELKDIILNEISQTQKNKYYVILFYISRSGG